MMRARLLVSGALAAGLLIATPAGSDAAGTDTAPVFEWPVRCVAGEDCFLRYFVDHVEGPGIGDYACGNLTYDGHKSTDIRVRDLAAMRHGFDVLSAAAGVVKAVRDGEPDLSINARGRDAIVGREAGNVVVIDHGGGWQTQYSHLKNGSVRVQPGERIKAGEAIGQIGLSGQTDFPHLDFSVRQNGITIDPYSGAPMGTDCHTPRTPMWSSTARGHMRYVPVGILHAGFATRPPSYRTFQAGPVGMLSMLDTVPAIIFYVSGFGTRAGDIQSISLTGPDGSTPLERRHELTATAPRPFRWVTWQPGVNNGAPWPAGAYQADYKVLRPTGDGYKVMARVRRTLTIKETGRTPGQ